MFEVRADFSAALLVCARAYDRRRKVVGAITDLGGETDIAPAHAAEAIEYRSPDRKLWSAQIAHYAAGLRPSSCAPSRL